MRPPIRLCKNLVFLFLFLLFTACSSSSSNEPETAADAATETPAPAETPNETQDDQPVEPTTNDDAPSLEEQLQTVLDEAVQSGIPGVSLFVQIGDEQISVVSGIVNRETEEPVTPDSLFQVASIGKIFTATLFMRFVDMNMLQLDDTIDTLLDPTMSELIADSDKITVEMLLAHTTGIQDYFNESEQFINDYANAPGKNWTPIEKLGYINSEENYFEPGTEFRYSNTNFVLLGAIAERLTGLTLGNALRQWVFEPAGLQNTYGSDEELGQPDISHGYIPFSTVENIELTFELPTDVPDIDTYLWLDASGTADAPINSSPSDLNQFIRTLANTDTLVSEDLKARMLTESFPNSSAYGLGIVVGDGGRIIGHEGKLFGLHSLLLYFLSEDISIATTVNASDDSYSELYIDYLDAMFETIGDSL